MGATGRAVVIGAGVIGCSIALELSRRSWEVEVVDKGPAAGSGSTSASSAIVRFNYSTLPGVITSWVSGQRWQVWGDFVETEDPAGFARFRRVGLVVIMPPSLRTAPELDLFDTVGVPYEEWDTATLARRLPAMDTGRYWPPKSPSDESFWQPASGQVAAYFTPDAGYVDDPQLAAHNLMIAGAAQGVQYRFGVGVQRIERGRRVRGVALSDGSKSAADVVVNAAGPWSHQVNELAGVLDEFSVPTRALRQEVHVVDVPDSFGDGCGAVCADTDLGTYFRPQVGGTLLVGGLEPECDRLEWVDDPDSHDPNPSVETWQAQTWRLGKRLPGLPLPRRPVGLAGLYDVTPDWIPVYDRTCLDGYYVAVGTSGNQFKNAPVVGELVSSLIEAVEGGHDHDQRPLSLQLQDGLPSVDMGHYSRLRQPLETTSSVLG